MTFDLAKGDYHPASRNLPQKDDRCMISRAILTRIDRVAIQGRTGPILSACETDSSEEVEVFVKLSAGCEQNVVNLAREAVAACLAADLGLPVPKPWLVEIPREIIPVVSDAQVADKLRRSCKVAFGSTRSTGFSVWSSGQRLSDLMKPLAVGILLFDAIIQNLDRRTENPNCLVRGTDLRIIDHELAFAHRLILFWRAPWVLGGMAEFETPGRHIFVHELKGKPFDFSEIKARWTALSDARLQEYEAAIPPEWAAARADIDAALKLIAEARDNIDACVEELGRILT
ncbi:HipA family kinase [Jiella sonneratiae]|uniref:HipA-like kinase domain-containing protein n=1 Tax=Jiella sonneratiae TaxID=2816856 RepID=A0ABS3IXL3_9HYPH|nr:HipA family kinase [Jiella sonneratiae]MBO0902159.1 hypothetical protein [Jiella sonneratiae]